MYSLDYLIRGIRIVVSLLLLMVLNICAIFIDGMMINERSIKIEILTWYQQVLDQTHDSFSGVVVRGLLFCCFW